MPEAFLSLLGVVWKRIKYPNGKSFSAVPGEDSGNTQRVPVNVSLARRNNPSPLVIPPCCKQGLKPSAQMRIFPGRRGEALPSSCFLLGAKHSFSLCRKGMSHASMLKYCLYYLFQGMIVNKIHLCTIGFYQCAVFSCQFFDWRIF